MARHPSDKKARRAIERHNERIADAAVSRLADLPHTELAEHAGSFLGPVGWSVTRDAAVVSDGIALRGEALLGVSMFPAAALILTCGAELTRSRLDAFLGSLDPEVHIAYVVCVATVADEARRAAATSWPLVLLHDRSSLLRLMMQSRTLMREVVTPPILLLQDPKRPAPRHRTTISGRTDRRGRAARLFHWRMEPLGGNRYALHGDYIPDAAQSFVIERELVPPDGDFAPARRELHQAVCQCLSRIFPELPISRVRTKAWAGVHKIYRAKVYGGQ